MKQYSKVCASCGTLYMTAYAGSTMCSDCKAKDRQKKQEERKKIFEQNNPKSRRLAWGSLSIAYGCNAVAGACSELAVCIDLMQRGFEVFRNVAGTGSVDLMAYGRNETILRVEVTTGRLGSLGGRERSQQAKHNAQHAHRRNILAIKYIDKIIYLDSQLNVIEPEGWNNPKKA